MSFLRSAFAFFVPFFVFHGLHCMCAFLYAYICVPTSFYGYLQSFVTIGNPLCNSILTLMTHTAQNYGAFIAGLIGCVVNSLNSVPNPEPSTKRITRSSSAAAQA